jgi:hypothetical protein
LPDETVPDDAVCLVEAPTAEADVEVCALCPAVRVAGCAVFAATPLPLFDALLVVLLLELPRSVVSVWLMLISCSRLFTDTNWFTYSLGSVDAVGSWFCSSVTNRVRKSEAEMVAESVLELLVLLDEPDEFAMGFALIPGSPCLVAAV